MNQLLQAFAVAFPFINHYSALKPKTNIHHLLMCVMHVAHKSGKQKKPQRTKSVSEIRPKKNLSNSIEQGAITWFRVYFHSSYN